MEQEKPVEEEWNVLCDLMCFVKSLVAPEWQVEGF